MARPVKLGLEYFTFDIDMFEDEKVLPVSVEFGAKGEAVVVRVLCAIYREGYFVQWSEGLKFKIANQAKLSEGLVSDVVLKLVKYHFFDEEIFNQHQVLTSAGIQKRWKEATRKRVLLEKKEFWILENPVFPAEETTVSGGRKAEETPLNRPETTQKKRKEKKRNKKEDIGGKTAHLQKSISDRSSDFMIEIWDVAKGTEFEDKTKLRKFYEYWSEHGKNDKKMRFEKETSFDIKRRLGTWWSNDRKFNRNTLNINGNENQESSYEIFKVNKK